MGMLRKNKKGFTLLELLIVLVILGVTAGLAFPVLTSQVEKSRAQEALTMLGTMKEAMVRYHQLIGNGSYTGASFDSTLADQTKFIGIDPNVAQAGQTGIFGYTFSTAASGDAFAIKALRKTGVAGVTDASGTAANNFITIDQAGTVTKSGVYK